MFVLLFYSPFANLFFWRFYYGQIKEVKFNGQYYNSFLGQEIKTAVT